MRLQTLLCEGCGHRFRRVMADGADPKGVRCPQCGGAVRLADGAGAPPPAPSPPAGTGSATPLRPLSPGNRAIPAEPVCDGFT